MDLVLDLLQGAGIAAAVGIRPLLPVLLVGALASANVGVNFDGTSFAFLESPAFLFGAVVLVAVIDVLRRRLGDDALERGPGFAGVALVALVLGALFAAGSMADHGHPALAGALAGVLCALLGLLSSRALFGRVRARLDPAAAGALPVYREAVALAAAGLSVLFPPLAVLVIAALVFLMAGNRRRSGEKYAGLRILR